MFSGNSNAVNAFLVVKLENIALKLKSCSAQIYP